ncbi:MAG: BadF/BadG/BcrA/BcrD ATPase family protein [Candidatus Babeliales bacterium]
MKKLLSLFVLLSAAPTSQAESVSRQLFDMKKLSIFSSIMLTSQTGSVLMQSIAKAIQGSEYTICLDGGGSKTEMQVLDKNRKAVQLKNKDTISDRICAPGSNINTVGDNGVLAVLQTLLNETMLEDTTISLASIAANCSIVGGFAGAETQEAKESITNLIKKFGFNANTIVVAGDAEIALEFASDNGIILISGTGSVCFGKNYGKFFRVGGLGRLIGDEGSGYQIGLAGLKAALEDEYGWGKATTLKEAIKKHFNLTELKNIIRPFHSGEVSPARIAAIAPIVFSHAEEGDCCAINIIDTMASNLGTLLATMVQKGKFNYCKLYFLGGTFKNKNADQFIKKIINAAKIDIPKIESWPAHNISEENPTMLVVWKARYLETISF